jgi:gliding motility-associated-like protein
MKNYVYGSLVLLFNILSGVSFGQGSDTQAGATGVPIGVPFNANGTTVGATNNFDQAGYNFDDGPDWYYYFCATNTNTIWITLTMTPSAANPVYPNITILSSLTAPANSVVAQTQIFGDNSGTLGIPYTPLVGECLYIIIDNDGVAGPNGFPYNLQITNTVPATPAIATQSGCSNIGFDNGSTSNWTGSWGHSMQTGVAPAPTPTYTPLFYNMTQGHHNVTTGGLDVLAPIQQVCPLIPGNTNSLRLGDGPNGAYGGARIEQKFSVTAANALFTYYYAAVIQDGGASGTTAHTDQEQPYFKIEALNCAGVPIACGNYLVTGGPGIPGFTQIGTTGTYWKDWTPVMLDLTPYIGSCVTIRFTIGDCSIGAHYAYAYLDATCAPMSIVAPPNVCQFQTSTLTAPTGAAAYSWVNTAAPGTVLSTTNTLSVTPTTAGTFNYQCTMTSVTGCTSTLNSSITVLPSPQITVTNPPPVCSPGTVDLTAPSVVTINSGSGTISYYSDAACTVPIASPGAITTSGTYYIKILNANGCFEVEPVTVVVNSTPTVNVTTADQTICAGQSVNLNATISPAATNTPVTFTNSADFTIPDGTSVQVVSPITVTGINPQTPGVLPIVSVCLNINHTWDQDLQIFLQCPNGSILTLSTDNGLDGDNYTNTCFTPTGPSIIGGVAPFTGNFSPEQAFTALNACNVNGTWNLLVSDNFLGDAGSLLDWSITFNNYTPGPTFAWSPTTAMTGATTLTPTVTPTATTTYTFTGTSASGGCTASDPVTITVNPLPTATIGSNATVCQNAAGPTITFTGANGTAPYTFTYNINGGANQTISSGAGTTATLTAPTTASGTFTYNLVSVSSNGCSQNQTGSAVITVNPLPTVTAPTNQTVCANASTTAVNFTGTAGATYTWTNNTTSIGLGASGTGNIAAFTATNATTSAVTATIAVTPTLAGCPGTPQNFTITVNPLPTVTAPTNQTVCANASTTAVTFTGTAGATYTWTNNTTSIGLGASGTGNIAAFTATNATASPVTATITVTPTLAGCPGTPQNFTITVNPLPTVTAPTNQTVCANASTTAVNFTGTAGATYTWTNNTTSIGLGTSGTGNIAAFTATNATASPVTATITVTPTLNGCTGTPQNFTITVNPIPTVTAPTNQTVCANASTTAVTFSGNNASTTYNWTNNTTSIGLAGVGTGTIAAFTATNATASPVTATIAVTPSLNGCTGTPQNFTITVNPSPTIGGTFTVCAGSTTQLTGSGTPAVTTPWTSSNTGVATVSTTGLITGITPGTSTITYTNSNGCSITQVVTITSGASITGTLAVCIGSTTQLTGSGTAAGTTPWTSSNTAVATVSNTGLVTGVSAGTATITYTNASGCNDQEMITVNPLPTVTGTDVCVGGTTSLTGSGTPAATTPWTSSNTAVATISSTGVVTGVTVGSTTITYTNSNGCSNTMTLNVVANPSISGTLSACVGSTTQLSAVGTPNATNPWTSSNTGVATVSNTGLVTGVSAGTSTITFTNSSGCQSTAVVTINPLPTISGTLSVCVSSTTQLTGSGTPAVTTPWTSSNTAVATVSSTGLVTGVAAGTTTITYTNTNGCGQTATVTVNPLPTASISGAATICAGNSASITITGTPNATITYSNGTTNATTVLNGAGTATVNTGILNATTTYTLVSAQSAAPASCSNPLTGSATITVNPIPVMDPVSSILACPGDAVTVPSFTSTPTGATFGWTNSNANIGLATTGTGNITFTATNAGTTPISGSITVIPALNGCVGSSQTFTVGVSNIPVANAGADLNLCLNALGGNQIGSTSLTGFTYSWSPSTGLSDPSISNPTVSTTAAATTTYTLTVTNPAGCTNTDNVNVTIHPLPVVSFSSNEIDGCAPVSITFTNNNAASSVNCVWTFEGGGSQTGCGPITHVFNTPGIFDVTLTVTDVNGCVNSSTQTDMITVYPEVFAGFGVNQLSTTILDPTFHFTNTSINATSYSWEFGDGSTSSQTNPSHTYADQPGVYHVVLHASNAAGCNDSVVVVIEVVDELIYYVPNTFTPDGDEFNNTFFPVFSSGFDDQSYTLLIFDRWGEVLFESHDVNVGWDGTYHNELCKEGVYTWKIVIKEKNKDKRHDLVGHVNLLK